MARYLLLLPLLALLELWGLAQVGRFLGFWPTLALLLLDAALGAELVRHAGLVGWRRSREALAMGRMPESGLLDALLVLLAGVLLIFPGFFTDLAAILLLLPPIRRRCARLLRRWIEGRLHIRAIRTAAGMRQRRASDEVIEVRPLDDEPDR